jgi:hypothetical protein
VVRTQARVDHSGFVISGVMQMAVDTENDLAAVVFVRDAKGQAKDGFKRRPTVYLLNLATGEDLWMSNLESEVEMMPAVWGNETFYTLDDLDYRFSNDEIAGLIYVAKGNSLTAHKIIPG